MLKLPLFRRINNDSRALPALLKVYEERADLQEVFPEAKTGDYARLIDWAAGVATKKWKDNSFASLKGYARWYSSRFTGIPRSPVWSEVKQTSEASGNPLPLTIAVMSNESSSDISHHLPLMSMLITEFNLKHIVELGVRAGNSTLVLLEAANGIGGRVLSVDLDPCVEAKNRVNKAGFGPAWKFLEGNDLEIRESDIFQPIDLLFIDSSHLYTHTVL